MSTLGNLRCYMLFYFGFSVFMFVLDYPRRGARSAYAQAFDPAFTDDATVFEAAGGSLRLVEGEPTNLKITTRDDLAVAESILKQRNEK